MKINLVNICIFASGAGSNFHSILRAANKGFLSSRISLLITNNSSSGAAIIARENGVECLHISKRNFAGLNEQEFASVFTESLSKRGIDFIALCGYMKPVPDEVLSDFKDKIINIHPALLPSFGGKGMYGINVHKAVIDSGVKVSGITVHFVDGVYDTGRIIFQKCCNVKPDDNEFTLEAKIKELEHEWYPQVIREFELGNIELVNGKAAIMNSEKINPH